MADRIYIDYDGIKAVAEKYSRIESRLENVYSQMSGIEERLDMVWDGSASEAALYELRQISASVKKCAYGASCGARVLASVVQVFQSVVLLGNGVADSGWSIRSPIIGADLQIPFVRLRFHSEMRMNPQEVISLAYGYGKTAVELGDVAQYHREALQGLQGTWAGKAFEKFMSYYRNYEKTLMKLSDSAEEAYRELVVIAERYRDLDRGRC